jgi:hypothetical protein
LACLISTADETSYGPVILLAGGGWHVNVPGCIAIVSGDLSASGCGAKAQAIDQCQEGACRDVCPVFDSFVACQGAANDSVCRSYILDNACTRKPGLGVCTGYVTAKEYYFGIAPIFCGPAITDAGGADALAE